MLDLGRSEGPAAYATTLCDVPCDCDVDLTEWYARLLGLMSHSSLDLSHRGTTQGLDPNTYILKCDIVTVVTDVRVRVRVRVRAHKGFPVTFVTFDTALI